MGLEFVVWEFRYGIVSWDLEFVVWGLKFLFGFCLGIRSLVFENWGFVFCSWDLEFVVCVLEFRDWDFEFWCLRIRIWVFGFGIWRMVF